MKKHYRHEDDCLNCGTILEGKFCHNCGQENLQIKESFGHMVNHAVSDYFHFDHQFFNTLKPLLLKPGKLTNDYMAGKRAQFLHPVKMYIFISLVFFVFVFQAKKDDGGGIYIGGKNKSEKAKTDSVRKAIDDNVDKNKSLSAAEKEKFKKNFKKFVPAEIDDEDKNTDSLKTKSDTGKDAKKVTSKDDDEDYSGFTIYGDDEDGKTYDDYLVKQNKLPAAERDNVFERYLKKKSFDWKKHGKGAREMFMESFKHNIPKMMFILLPLFALILKVAFWNNRKFYVEHLIYTIHLHCCIFLFLTIIMVTAMILPESVDWISDWLNFGAFVYIVWYVYRSLRTVYQRSRGRTISKMFGISFMYSFALAFCFVIILAITAITTV